MQLVFVDSNTSLEASTRTRPILEHHIAEGERLGTDAEVLQEILHRYTAMDRRDAIQPAFDALLGVADHVFPVELEDVERAKVILMGRPRASARGAIHVAVMERHGIGRIVSFDGGLDCFPGITRAPR